MANVEALAQCLAGTPDELAETIARGHAFKKHVEGVGNEGAGREFEAGRVIARLAFPSPSITDPDAFAKLLRRILESGENEAIQKNRHKYWDRRTGTVVIVDMKSRDCGTAFRPNAGKRYFDGLR